MPDEFRLSALHFFMGRYYLKSPGYARLVDFDRAEIERPRNYRLRVLAPYFHELEVRMPAGVVWRGMLKKIRERAATRLVAG